MVKCSLWGLFSRCLGFFNLTVNLGADVICQLVVMNLLYIHFKVFGVLGLTCLSCYPSVPISRRFFFHTLWHQLPPNNLCDLAILTSSRRCCKVYQGYWSYYMCHCHCHCHWLPSRANCGHPHCCSVWHWRTSFKATAASSEDILEHAKRVIDRRWLSMSLMCVFTSQLFSWPCHVSDVLLSRYLVDNEPKHELRHWYDRWC